MARNVVAYSNLRVRLQSRGSPCFHVTVVWLLCLCFNLLLCFIPSTDCVSIPSKRPRPNIVFILADDLGWDDVGFHGSDQISTPHLDALAYDGIILANYYVQQLCTPSRAALLTGRHPIHLGLQHDVLISAQPYGLPLNETTLPDYLKPYGYKSHMIGKWHLGFFQRNYLPTNRGFDSHYGYYQGCGDYYDHTYMPVWPDDHKSWGFDFHQNGHLERPVFGQYSTDLFTRRAERIIADHNTSEPLFLYLSHQAVHSGNPLVPLEAPWKYMEKMSHIKSKMRQTYAAMVASLDESVGNVTRALFNRGMLDNTIIVFSTDNGGPAHGFDLNDASNWPLRGLKATIWEGGLRGTGFIWSPLLKQSQYTSHHLMHITDWLPTLLHAAASEDAVRQLPAYIYGVDQWDVLSENRESVRKELLHNIDPEEQSKSIRVGDMKLVQAENGPTRHCAGWYPTDHSNSSGILPSPCDNNYIATRHVGQEFYVMGRTSSTPSHDKLGQHPWVHKFWKVSNREIQQQQHRRASKKEVSTRRTSSRKLLDNSPSDLWAILDKVRRHSLGNSLATRSPLVVDCGRWNLEPRFNAVKASNECLPWRRPCLFNITADPCEYHNLADQFPELVQDLSSRLGEYERTARKPLNKPIDDAGLPYRNNWNWIPWVKDDVL